MHSYYKLPHPRPERCPIDVGLIELPQGSVGTHGKRGRAETAKVPKQARLGDFAKSAMSVNAGQQHINLNWRTYYSTIYLQIFHAVTTNMLFLNV